MKSLLLLGLTLSCSLASAVTETTAGSFSGFEQSAITASSRAEALITDSIYYSLPHQDMTYIELGSFNQRQTIESADIEGRQTLSNQAFYFNHSRGLTDNLALDFNLDYFVRDENVAQGSTGVNRILLGGRSHFNAIGIQWIYGLNVAYLPQGELHETDSKAVVAGRFGMEETVDIARWGIEAEATTENSYLFDQQVNLQGFFEMPFVRRFDVGVAAGTDLSQMATGDYNNFARVYGDFSIDPVSSARVSLRQNDQSKDTQSLSQADIGISLTRAF